MSSIAWERKDLLAIADLSADEIRLILATADSFREIAERPIKKVPTWSGMAKRVAIDPRTLTRARARYRFMVPTRLARAGSVVKGARGVLRALPEFGEEGVMGFFLRNGGHGAVAGAEQRRIERRDAIERSHVVGQ